MTIDEEIGAKGGMDAVIRLVHDSEAAKDRLSDQNETHDQLLQIAEVFDSRASKLDQVISDFELQLALLDSIAEQEGEQAAYHLFARSLENVLDMIARLEQEENRISDPKALKQIVWDRLWHIASCSEVISHTRRKPYGYDGDFEIKGVLHKMPELSKGQVGRFLDRYIYQMLHAQATRTRCDYIEQSIVEHCGNRNAKVTVTSIAAGPAMVAKTMLERQDADRYRFVLTDHHKAAVKSNRTWIQEWGVAEQAQAIMLHPVRLIRGRDIQKLKDINADVIFTAGLFDYLETDAAILMLQRMYESLADGGMLMFGNYTSEHHSRRYQRAATLLHYLMDWELIYRSPNEMLGLMKAAGIPSNKMYLGREALAVDIFGHAVK